MKFTKRYTAPTVQDVRWLAKKLKIPVQSVYDDIKKQSIPPECILRVGGRIRVVESKVNAWINGEIVVPNAR